MNFIFDMLLLGIASLFQDSEAKRQKYAFKHRKAIAEAKRKMDGDTGLGYIILDELAQGPNQGFKYQEPPTEDFHCHDDDGPDW
jgi:hypothetical protein